MSMLGELNEKINGKKSTDNPKMDEAAAKMADLKRGDDILEKARGTTEVETVQENPTVKDPDTWSKDSALKEVVKLREENKAVRTKFQEQLDKVRLETEAQIQKIKEEASSAYEAKKKLEAVEAEAADKKRSIEEKLADREAKLVSVESNLRRELEQKEQEILSYKSKALQYEAELEARRSQYRDRIKEELAKVPEEYREFAEAIVKGKEEPQEAWLALSAARDKGLFLDKKTVVNHSTPGVKDGARLSHSNNEQKTQESSRKPSSTELIRRALGKVKSGESNSAFKK